VAVNIDEDLLPLFAQDNREIEAPLILDTDKDSSGTPIDPKKELENLLSATVDEEEVESFSDAIKVLESQLCSATDAEALALKAAEAAELSLSNGEELSIDRAPIIYEQRGDCLVVMGGVALSLLELLLDLTFEGVQEIR
jgi:hypothetical protein